MNIHDRLYRYFHMRRAGAPSRTTNLSGLYGGDDWIIKHCEVACALRRLPFRTLFAVGLRYHYLLMEDEFERAIRVSGEGVRVARRENKQGSAQSMRQLENRMRNESDRVRRRREEIEDGERYRVGMEFLSVRLAERVVT